MSQSVSQGTPGSGDKRGTPSGSGLSGGSASKAPRAARFFLKVSGISGENLAVPGLGAGSQRDPPEYAAMFGTGGVEPDVAPIALLAPVSCRGGGGWGVSYQAVVHTF